MSETDNGKRTKQALKWLLAYAVRVLVILGIHVFLDVTVLLFAAIPAGWLAFVSAFAAAGELTIFFFTAQSLGRNDHRKLVRYVGTAKGAPA